MGLHEARRQVRRSHPGNLLGSPGGGGVHSGQDSREEGHLFQGFVLFAGRGDIQPQLDSALQDVNDKYLLLEETEKQAVRKALIEERGRFCTFISMLRPVIVS